MSDPDQHALTDEAFDTVLDAAHANAGWAFERLYDEVAPGVAGYLRMRGAADPDGLTNEVMLGVFRGLAGFTGDRQHFRSWTFTIAHHRLVDERRRTAVRPATTPLTDGHQELGAGDVEREAVEALGGERVTALLAHLTVEQRDVVLLRVIADLSVEDVAHALGKRPGAVKMLQRRALATLRRLLEAEGVTP